MMRVIAWTSPVLAALLASSAAQALEVSYDPLSTALSYYAPLGGVNTGTGTYSPDVTGSVPGYRTSPFADNTTHYDSVGADAVVTFGEGPTTTETDLFRSAYTEGPSSGSFGSGSGTFTFVWGSPDRYNTLSFYEDGSLIGSVTGAGSPTIGSGAYIATVSGIGDFNGVRFESTGANAFEFAAISPVPLPNGLPMFGAALAALGLAGYGARKRRTTRA